MKIQKTPLFLLLILFILSSCAPSSELYKKSQIEISKGAKQEINSAAPGTAEYVQNTDFGNIFPQEEASTSDSSQKNYYEVALDLLNKALKNKGELKKNELLANALTLKAICEWKLKKYAIAPLTADEAIKEFENSNSTEERDRALAVAIDGFVSFSLAKDSLGAIKTYLEEKLTMRDQLIADEEKALEVFLKAKKHYNKFIANDNSSSRTIATGLDIIDRAKEKVGPKHEVQLYLLTHQLLGIKTWFDEFSAIHNASKLIKVKKNNEEAKAWLDQQSELNAGIRKAYLKELEEALPGGKEHKIYKIFAKIL